MICGQHFERNVLSLDSAAPACLCACSTVRCAGDGARVQTTAAPVLASPVTLLRGAGTTLCIRPCVFCGNPVFLPGL